jgi:DNA mismatch repair protein MutS2
MPPMPYEPGDEVVVLALNRRGRVIDRAGTRYRVAVGALVSTCAEDELRPPHSDSRRRHRPAAAVPAPDTTLPPPRPRRLDLHGYTTEQARAAVLAFVNEALLDGVEEIAIVHGIGTGRVRQAVLDELASVAAVRHVRPHPTNPGVTIVHL